jgi:hypothetical protein
VNQCSLVGEATAVALKKMNPENSPPSLHRQPHEYI